MPDPGFSSTARAQVQEILSRPPYRAGPSHTPRPLAGVFHALGRVLRAAAVRPARWVYHHLLAHIGHGFAAPFGGWWPVPAALLAVGGGSLVAVVLVRRRSRVGAVAAAPGRPEPAEDAAALEDRATAAEADGDHETAVRLRFRAGLLRLHKSGLLADFEARTGRQLSTILPSDTFRRLAGTHERIVYARHPATSAESAESRSGWPRVPGEVRSAQSVATR